MPKLGESVTEGTINTWLVKVGDTVNKYDPIVDVMTDKVNAEVPSSYSGVIEEIVAEEGETVAVGELICYIKVETREDSVTKSEKEEKETKKEHDDSKNNQSMRNRYSPAVVKLASENQIDLQQVKGTGLGGRITRKDIEAFIANEHSVPLSSKSKDEPVQTKSKQISGKDKEIVISGVRKAIADNMVRSKQEIPHAWMTIEVDVTELVTL